MVGVKERTIHDRCISPVVNDCKSVHACNDSMCHDRYLALDNVVFRKARPVRQTHTKAVKRVYLGENTGCEQRTDCFEPQRRTGPEAV